MDSPTTPAISHENSSFPTLIKTVEAFVRQEKLQNTELPETSRILRNLSKPLHNSFTTTTVTFSQQFLIEESRKKLVAQEDSIVLALAEKIPVINSNTIINSSDSQKLVVFWKNAVNLPWGSVRGEQLITEVDAAITKLQTNYKPPKPPATDKRHKNSTTIEVPNSGVIGLWHFAWWFAQGQSKTKKPVISAHLVDTASKQQTCIDFFQDIAPILQVIGMVYEVMDPTDYYAALSRVRTTRKTSAWNNFATSRRFPFHGLALLRNLRVKPHMDGGDRKDGYTMMICAGKFTKGYLVIPALNIKLDFKPDDVIMFKASILKHYLTEYEGDRTSFVFFTHQNIWDYTKQ